MARATAVLAVDPSKIGRLSTTPQDDLLDELDIELDESSVDAQHLRHAANQLRESNVPVAFGTETVYGLGADATRSDAVLGIYRAKQRPSDNPLIVHIASLRQLRSLLQPQGASEWDGGTEDRIPDIYKPLIRRFWPGPLTILLPNPDLSSLAPEVTAGLATFGARMPRHPIALALIKLADVPVAAPSANASTKPSPTAAEHVAFDLDGRIEIILDSGPCDVGVESTVVDGLSSPPLILRPGGISIEQLRQCPGWADVEIGYKNVAELGQQPKAPGMKYRHYSPKAPVILYESGSQPPSPVDLVRRSGSSRRLGVVITKSWRINTTDQGNCRLMQGHSNGTTNGHHEQLEEPATGLRGMLQAMGSIQRAALTPQTHKMHTQGEAVELVEICLGHNTSEIARGIFAALRDLDRQQVDAILVEGIDDGEGETAAAIMNRLRKAAEVNIGT